MKKGLKRCPECKSSNVHKRHRILLECGSNKGRRAGIPTTKRERITKYYKCYKCKYEFNTPVVS